MGPAGMFDPWAPRGWGVSGMWNGSNQYSGPGNWQLDPDQQYRYDTMDRDQHNQYGYGASYVQTSGQAPWAPEIRT